MGAIISQAVAYLLRGVVGQFVAMTVIAGLIVVMWPLVKELVGPFVNFAAIDSALAGLPAGVWYFLAWARVDLALPLTTGALVTRFIVRRLPVVG